MYRTFHYVQFKQALGGQIFVIIRDPKWIDRLKEEYMSLIKYIEVNKLEDNDWVKIQAENKE